MIGVPSRDIFGAEKAAKDETTPLDGDPGEAVLEAGGGVVRDDVDAIFDDESDVDVDEVLSVEDEERAGTVGAVR